MISPVRRMQVFCDGESFFIIHDTHRGIPVGFKINDPVFDKVVIESESNVGTFYMEGMSPIRKHIGPTRYEINLSIAGYDIEMVEGPDFKFGMGMFEKMSIKDLFKVINKKINERR